MERSTHFYSCLGRPNPFATALQGSNFQASHQYGILLYQVVPLHSTGDPSPHSPVVEVRQTQKNQKSYKYGGTEQHREKVHHRSVTLVALNVDSQII